MTRNLIGKTFKLSFRRGPRPTGLSAVGNPYPDTDIKCGGQKVGYISGPTWQSKDHKWVVRFMVFKADIMEDNNPNCSWKWVTLKQKFDSEREARDYVAMRWPAILKLNLRKENE